MNSSGPLIACLLCLRSAGLAVLLATLACGQPEPQRWNVLLVSFDTTRADHVGCYGNDEVATPVIDQLATEGVRFARAYSPIPLTTPSHATMITGRYPPGHGVRDNGLFNLPDSELTLAEILRDNGWATAAAVGAFPLDARFNLGQGFDLYDDHLTTVYEDLDGRRVRQRQRLFFDERRAAQVNEAVYPWLEEHHAEPFFLWIHYYDPHRPWEPPPPYNQLFGPDSYEGEIAYADESLGNLRRFLEGLGSWQRTLVVFVSDHGEGLDEHRESTHSLLAYNATLHVPLIMVRPGTHPAHVVEQPVTTADIVPTVLDLLGLEAPSNLHGRSLAPLLDPGTPPLPDRLLYAETLSPRLSRGWGELRALYDNNWKLVWGPRPELFDIAKDPGETENLYSLEPNRAAELKTRLAALIAELAATASPIEATADADTRQRLQALGYVQAGSAEDIGTIREELMEGGIPPQDHVDDINQISLARHHLFQGRPLAARGIAEQALARNPDDRFYLELLARSQTLAGQLDEALATIDGILERGSTSGTAEELLIEIGRRLHHGGDRDRGLGRVRQSLELQPTARGHYVHSELLATAGRLAEARTALEQAVELDPSFLLARIDLAVRRAQNGDRIGALSDFDQLLREHPYLARIHFNFGAFLVNNPTVSDRDLERAATCFDRAIELEPAYKTAYLAAITAHNALGRRQRAEELMAQLEVLAPREPGTRRAREILTSEGS